MNWWKIWETLIFAHRKLPLRLITISRCELNLHIGYRFSVECTICKRYLVLDPLKSMIKVGNNESPFATYCCTLFFPQESRQCNCSKTSLNFFLRQKNILHKFQARKLACFSLKWLNSRILTHHNRLECFCILAINIVAVSKVLFGTVYLVCHRIH